MFVRSIVQLMLRSPRYVQRIGATHRFGFIRWSTRANASIVRATSSSFVRQLTTLMRIAQLFLSFHRFGGFALGAPLLAVKSIMGASPMESFEGGGGPRVGRLFRGLSSSGTENLHKAYPTSHRCRTSWTSDRRQAITFCIGLSRTLDVALAIFTP